MTAVLSLLLLATPPAQPRAQAIAAYADSLVGKHDLSGGGRRFRFDSVGVVRAAFLQFGIDLFAAPAQLDIERSGVDVVYQYAALNGKLHLRRRPSVGDLCFFGKTRDYDQDGAVDTISHVGVVTQVAADGTATIVTAGRSRVLTLMLNRYRPKDAQDELGQALNGRIFVGTKNTAPKLASELFYTFATIVD
ncbi:MAG: C40 family peptidase [Deltaproteobacteria bacterium]|nr:C40 family peptidase [Deltaproteobacteria bacterium]